MILNNKPIKPIIKTCNSNGRYVIMFSMFGFILLTQAQAQTYQSREIILGKHISIPYGDSAEIKRVSTNPLNDLVQYPIFKYEINTSLINPLRIGDKIPKELLNMPLRVVGKNTPSDTITLKDIPKHKILVLDFWASWCAPCIQSMEKWESIASSLKGNLEFLGVHIDYDYKAYPFINQRNWNSRSVIGLNAYVLNRFFFDRKVVSRIVWIKDGRVFAITGGQGYDVETVKRVLIDDNFNVPSELEWTYEVNVRNKSNN